MGSIEKKAAANILRHRQRKGLTQIEVSDLAAIPLRTYQRAEDPDHGPSLSNLEAIAQALELAPWELLKGDDETTTESPPIDLRTAIQVIEAAAQELERFRSQAKARIPFNGPERQSATRTEVQSTFGKRNRGDELLDQLHEEVVGKSRKGKKSS